MRIDLIDNLEPMEMVTAKMLLTTKVVLQKEDFSLHQLTEKADLKYAKHDPSIT